MPDNAAYVGYVEGHIHELIESSAGHAVERHRLAGLLSGVGGVRRGLRRDRLAVWGSEFGQQYYAGYLIQKSPAVDNVFVWTIIFAHFAVPARFQHRVLLLGLLGAPVVRGIFIAAGAALIQNFSCMLYIFGAFLLSTVYRMIRQHDNHLNPPAVRRPQRPHTERKSHANQPSTRKSYW